VQLQVRCKRREGKAGWVVKNRGSGEKATWEGTRKRGVVSCAWQCTRRRPRFVVPLASSVSVVWFSVFRFSSSGSINWMMLRRCSSDWAAGWRRWLMCTTYYAVCICSLCCTEGTGQANNMVGGLEGCGARWKEQVGQLIGAWTWVYRVVGADAGGCFLTQKIDPTTQWKMFPAPAWAGPGGNGPPLPAVKQGWRPLGSTYGRVFFFFFYYFLLPFDHH
jgi:hypothetical protein